MSLKDKVLVEIENLRGNARFPSVLDICYSGEATDCAKRLGVGRHDTEEVLTAVKRLHEDGKVKFVYRWGYTWVVPSWKSDIKDEELIQNPTDRPYNWEQL